MRIASLVFGMMLFAAWPGRAAAEDSQATPTNPGPSAEAAIAAIPASAGAPEPAAEMPPAEPTADLDGEPESPVASPSASEPREEAASEPLEETVSEPTEQASSESVEPMPAALPMSEGGVVEAGPTLGPVGYDAQGRPGRVHVVRRGDTLWDISEAYLGTPWVWPSIWDDNPDVANPHRIYPGDRIWITPTEMRRVTAEEAEQLLAGRPASNEPEPAELPAAIADAPVEPTPLGTIHWSGIEGAGLVRSEALDAAASILGSPTPIVWYSQGNTVYVGLGEDEVRVGDQFSVVRAIKPVRDLTTGDRIGFYVEKLGWLEITEVHPETSLATVKVSDAEMRSGDRLLVRQVPSPEIALRPTPSGIEGRILYTPDSRTTMARDDLVFLNRGTDHGLEVGNELEVYRPGRLAFDAVRHMQVRLPDDVLGRLLVVSAQPGTAVALVTDADTELSRGDRFRGSGGLAAR